MTSEESEGEREPAGPTTHGSAHGLPIKIPFLEQFKQRNVGRIAILYLVIGYLVLEIFGVFFHLLAMPEWVGRAMVILVALGFPVALLFAWAYEVTPEGIRPSAEVDPKRSIAQQTGRRLDFAIMALMAIALTYFVIDKFWLSKRVLAPVASTATGIRPMMTMAAPEKSIAVLPFTDMSEKKDQEYFADGMAEEIIDLLAKVPSLHVPARTSSFYFKGKSAKISDIARELNVEHVLEGSVRKVGSRLRITAQLVRADNGYHLWSETYDRDEHDLFRVQDDIANAVVQALRITLMGGTLARTGGGTKSLEAYQLYVRAKEAIDQNSRASLDAARGYAEKAIKIDPNFGLAWLALANEAMLMTDIGGVLPQEGYERARQLAQRAVELSPELSDAYAVLIYVRRTLDWDWSGSEAEASRGLAVDPTSPAVLTMAGLQSATLGRWDEADRRLNKALVRDPLNTSALFNLATALYNANRFPEAEAALRKTLDLAPDYAYGYAYLAKTLLAEGKYADALAAVGQEQDEEARACFLPMALQAVGRKGDARRARDALVFTYAGDAAYYVAMADAYAGDRDSAIAWLERAYVQKDPTLVEMIGEPLLRDLSGDPRYQAFLRKMKLPGL